MAERGSARRQLGLALALLLALAWASAGVEPLAAALAGAVAPTDFTRDWVTAHAFVHRGGGEAFGTLDLDGYGAGLGAPRVPTLGAPYNFHPPPALLLVIPLVPLGYRGAATAWLALSLIALGVLARALLAAVNPAGGPGHAASAGRLAGTYLLLALWPPVLHNLAKGQWSILLAALAAAGWQAFERGRPRAAGIWLGVAASLKATPLLLLGFFLLRRRRAAGAATTAGAMAATIAALAVVSLAIEGPLAWRAFLAAGPLEVAAWKTWTANTASLGGLFARLFEGGAYARPLVQAPVLAMVLTFGAGFTLVGAAMLATHRAPPGPAADRRLFAAWCLAGVMLNPLGWTHTLALALIAAALCARQPATATATAVAVIVWSIPRETLLRLAGPTPVAPAGGLLLGAHALAALALAAAALASTARKPSKK